MSEKNNSEDMSNDVLAYVTKQQAEEITELKQLAKDSIEATATMETALEQVLQNQVEFKKNAKEVNKRISAMEWTVTRHSETMDAIIKDQSDLTNSLKNIQDIITQIKWIGYGALGMYALQVLGVKEILKGLL